MWILWCLLRLLDEENFFPQTSHSKGFSPVWVLLCLTRLLFSANDLLQMSHWNGFSPVWILSCLTKICLSYKSFGTNVTLWICSLMWLLPSLSILDKFWSKKCNNNWKKIHLRIKRFLITIFILFSNQIANKILVFVNVWVDFFSSKEYWSLYKSICMSMSLCVYLFPYSSETTTQIELKSSGKIPLVCIWF